MSNETYWMARYDRAACEHGEVIGIFIDDGHPIINRIDMAIGHCDWWLSLISESEYETYEEFGFKILELEPYEL